MGCFIWNVPTTLANVDETGQPITEVLDELSEKYQVFFTYDVELLKDVSVDAKDLEGEKLDLIINQILAPTNLRFEQLGEKYFVIFANSRSGKKTMRKMKRKIKQIQKLEKKGNINLEHSSKKIDKKLDNVLSSAATIIAETIRGTVTEAGTDEPLIGASVVVEGTTNGDITDINGNFSITVESLPVNVIVSYTGYTPQKIAVTKAGELNIQMAEGIALDQIVVTGTRGKPRTILTSAVPIDNINTAELKASGQKSVDQMITYKVPSYNSSNQAISDGTAHLDPSELRNLGPSRTLVLINGKRKNQSAQVYLNRTQGEFNLDGGITTEGDGETFSGDVNYGLGLGDNGYLNLTGEFYYQGVTDRAGEFANTVGDPLFGIPLGTSPELDQYFTDFPDLGITYGQPEISKFAGMANFGTNYDNGKFYGILGYTKRSGKSFAFYRTSYWRDTDFGLLTPQGEPYIGYQPTFESDIDDITFTIGNEYKFGEWGSDISLTYGSNSIDYTVNNSLNRTLEGASPTSFNPGGYSFNNILGNIDLTRSFDKLSIALGTEIRREGFVVTEGEMASHSPAPGTDSFPGLTAENAKDENRTNVGVYVNADYDATESFLIGGAVRFENYSDFGSNFSWKLNARQLLGGSKGAIRASVSTGFRAPSLHQIFLSNIQTTAGASGLIQEGTFDNNSDLVRNVLGVPQLDAETSFNITAGLTYKLAENFSATLDYYNIKVNDRVLFSDQIGASNFENTPLGDALATANVDAFKFFINAADTRTSGFDIVLNYENINLGSATNQLDLIFAMNINETELDGTIQTPDAFGTVSIFGDLPSRLLTSARPNTKVSFASNWKFGKIRASLNNTYFGEVSSPVSGQEFAGKLITDLILGYEVSESFRFSVTANNLFNVYPDRIDGELDPFGYRLQYPWRVNQFGFLGTIVKAGLSLKF